MRKLSAPLLGLMLTSALALSAQAAEIYRGGGLKDVPEVIPVQTWTGFYLGGNVGGAFVDNNNKNRWYDGDGPWHNEKVRKEDCHGRHCWEDVTVLDGNDFWNRNNNNDSQFIGGVQAGFNWQRVGSPLVVGFEVDADFSDNVDYLVSARGKLGFGFQNVLLYATGGGAWIGLNNDNKFGYDGDGWTSGWGDNVVDHTYTVSRRDNDKNFAGWVVGGGIDFKPGSFGLLNMLGSNVSFGVLGLYYNFENANNRTWDVYNDDGQYWRYGNRDSLDFWTVTARLNWNFGGDYAVAAVPLK
jgi:outer membrane immunogenic protein